MKPLNSRERTSAIWKFSLFYAVTVVFAVMGFVFLLYVPDNALKAENTGLNLAMNEQKKLVVLIDSMGRQLKGLENLDASFNQMTNEFDQAQGIRKMNEYEDHIQTIVYETKRDSAALIYPSNKKMAFGIINSLDAFLTYRNTIGLLRQTIKEKGINMEQIEALNNKLKDTEQQLETYKILLASKPADAGGGGGGKAPNKDVEKLQLQLKDCEDQLKLAQAQASKGDASAPVDVTPLQNRISELEAKLVMSKAYSDESKAESRITNCNQRKGLYQSALVVFKEYQNSNLESIKKEAAQKVADITAKLKKPPVGCE
jgi:hypothetical protein